MHNLQKASVFTATVLLHCQSEIHILSTFGESFLYNQGHYLKKMWNIFTFKAHKKETFLSFLCLKIHSLLIISI
jgi:hypothetical protein